MAEVSTPVPAATVLLVRQERALEVLMVRRHHQIDFVSGALVFPGGKLSADDVDPRWLDHVETPAGIDNIERELRIAAIREAFEESGIMLAREKRGGPLASPEAFAALHERRAAISEGKESFLAALEGAGLIAALNALVPFAHWITPEGVGRRFDTHFFIAGAPEGQVEACDGREAVEAVWLEPAAALEEGRAGKWQIVFPTRLNLERLAETTDVESALAAARARKIVSVTPKIVTENGARTIHIPAEAGYSITAEPFTR